MTRIEIPVFDLTMRPFFMWDKTWFLLTAGDFKTGKFNTMTVSWGGLGVLWNKPFIQVVVRPTRYTYQFTEAHDTFTLCAFSEKYRTALNLLGKKSGRDGDKIAESGLTPQAAIHVAAPVFAEAELAFECHKLYWHDFTPGQFLDNSIEKNYPAKDYHRSYLGEILVVTGEEKYRGGG